MPQEVDNRDRHLVVGSCLIYKPLGQDNFQYYIAKRSPKRRQYPNLWEVVGGAMDRADYEGLTKTSKDAWENPVEIALRREIMDETALAVGSFEYLGHFAFIRVDDVPVLGMRFAAPYVSGEVVLNPDEATEYAWITAVEVSAYNFLGSIADEIHKFDKKLKSRIF